MGVIKSGQYGPYNHTKSVAFLHRGMHLLIACCLLLVPEQCVAQKVAITFDDLPQNGILPSGVNRRDIAGSALAILAQEHVPSVFGFINAGKLEGDIDGAEALKLWAAAEPVGSHTYTHIDLHQNTVDAFERDVELVPGGREETVQRAPGHLPMKWELVDGCADGDECPVRDKWRRVAR
jgi:peptidoglycan/xylan/chitin deacetylase (PgdA/CDA1 family)